MPTHSAPGSGQTIPLLNPRNGQSAKERKEEVLKYREAIAQAKGVLIAGAGGSGVKMLGDIHAIMDLSLIHI